jgi:hypothetical protein
MVTASDVEAKLKEKLDAADVVGAHLACVYWLAAGLCSSGFCATSIAL